MTFQKARRTPWRPDRPSAAIETHWRRRERATPLPDSALANHLRLKIQRADYLSDETKAAMLRRD
jgi:hypothetical protein